MQREPPREIKTWAADSAQGGNLSCLAKVDRAVTMAALCASAHRGERVSNNKKEKIKNVKTFGA